MKGAIQLGMTGDKFESMQASTGKKNDINDLLFDFDTDMTKEERRKIEILIKFQELLNKKNNPNDPIKVFPKLGLKRDTDIMDLLQTEYDD